MKKKTETSGGIRPEPTSGLFMTAINVNGKAVVFKNGELIEDEKLKKARERFNKALKRTI